MDKQPCPLCQKQRPSRKFKRLYNSPVCHKCYYAFTNRRQIAYLIDVILWRIAMFLFFSAVGFILAAALPNPNTDWSTIELGLTILSWGLVLVFIFKDGFGGCSPGKAICGVVVVDQDTYEPIGFGRSFKRNLPIAIPLVPLYVAFTLAKGRRLGDGWANSKVIWSKYRNHPVFTAQTYCPKCQYDLRANTSGNCPECGQEIDDHTRQVLASQYYDDPPIT